MQNVALLQRTLGEKLDWDNRDWISFLNALYTDTSNDVRIKSIVDRVTFENREPNNVERQQILDFIRAKYIENGVDNSYIFSLNANHLRYETSRFHRVLYDLAVLNIGSSFGNLLNDNFGAGLSNYTIEGAATWIPDVNGITTTGGATTFLHRLIFNYYNSFEVTELEVNLKLNVAVGASTFGIGIGFLDSTANSPEQSVIAQFHTTNNATYGGKVIIWSGDTVAAVTEQVRSSTAITLITGEEYILKLTKDKTVNSRFTATVTRVSTRESISCTITEALVPAAQPFYSNATSRFAIFSLGSSTSIKYFSVKVTDKKNVNTLILGDSITHGFSATNLTGRFGDNLNISNYEISAGAGDYTNHILLKMQNIIEYKPKRVLLAIGTNDIAGAISSGVWQANYASIVSQLKNAGIQVIILLPVPRTLFDMTPLITYLTTTFSNEKIIDLYTPLKGAGFTLNATYDSGDGVHPNQAGHTLMANIIKANI